MQQTDVSRGLELSKKSHKLNLNERREREAEESFWSRSGQQTSKDVRGKRSSLPKIATASIITQCIKIDNDISFTWGFFSRKSRKYSDFVGVLYVLQLLAQYQMMRLFSRILTTVQRWCKTSKKCFCFLAAPRHPLCLSACYNWWYEWTWTQLHTFAALRVATLCVVSSCSKCILIWLMFFILPSSSLLSKFR